MSSTLSNYLLSGRHALPLIDHNIKLDVLVCNPPFIPANREYRKADFEPHVALFGGEDGLFFYHSVFENAHKVIKINFMAFEIGYDEKEA